MSDLINSKTSGLLHSESVKKLQKEAHDFFYDSMTCEINDALTSILAMCEQEDPLLISKVKQYIHRINQSLDLGRQSYSALNQNEKYNINFALENLLYVLKSEYKNLKILTLLSDIHIPTKGSQYAFEQFFLYIFTYFFVSEDKSGEILVELRQKGHQILLTLVKDDCSFKKQDIHLIQQKKDELGFLGWVNLSKRGEGLELVIQIPIQFKMVNFK